MGVFIQQKPRLIVPKRTVLPNRHQARFRCGKCGCAEFRAHARRANGKIDELICRECLAIYKLDSQARVGGKLEA